MSVERTDTLVVGAGQAGIAMSEHLSTHGIPHIVLERHRIAERWRSERWDSLVANGPAWHDRFPNMIYPETAPDEFPGKERVADYFEAYARMIDAPIRCGAEVTSVQRLDHSPYYRATTSVGVFEAKNIVAATGPFQRGIVPDIIPSDQPVTQLHSSRYKSPEQLPDGAVLVVGAGASGVQIADELVRAGKTTFLSVGQHDRPPRAYRGRDYGWWLGVLGKWDATTPKAGAEHIAIAVSGAYGGHTIDFRKLAARGVKLVGLTRSFDDGVLHFADDLAANIAAGDANYLSVLDEADAYVEANGLDLPQEPQAREILPDPPGFADPVTSLDIAEEDITSIIWATGFAVDYGWLEVDCFDGDGRPIHQRGVSRVPGVYFLGLPWLSRRGSSFIWGVWHDARYIADQIAIQRNYQAYSPAELP